MVSLEWFSSPGKINGGFVTKMIPAINTDAKRNKFGLCLSSISKADLLDFYQICLTHSIQTELSFLPNLGRCYFVFFSATAWPWWPLGCPCVTVHLSTFTNILNDWPNPFKYPKTCAQGHEGAPHRVWSRWLRRSGFLSRTHKQTNKHCPLYSRFRRY